MNAGRNLTKAKEWARANARFSLSPRYITMYNGVYWIDREPPSGRFGDHDYWEVMPNGVIREKRTQFGQTIPNRD